MTVYTPSNEPMPADGPSVVPAATLVIYAARVTSAAFAGKPRVAQHKMVYEALGGRMGGVLHALQLTTAVPN